MKPTKNSAPLAAAAALLAITLTSGLAGCGEYPQVTHYQPGNYQGKADTRPWEGGQFKGDKQAWENALANRNQGQNEYKRVP